LRSAGNEVLLGVLKARKEQHRCRLWAGSVHIIPQCGLTMRRPHDRRNERYSGAVWLARSRFNPRLPSDHQRVACSDMALSGVFTPVLAKHSKSLSLIDCISVGVDRMQRNFESMRKQMEAWQRSDLTAF
jgi:hypothetical protein